MFQQILDHIILAKKRLISQYKQKPRLEGLVEALVQDIQNLENTAVQLNTERGLDTAVGEQLDGIGQIVGLERETGQSDDDYRTLIKAKIGINLSQGEPERMIQIYKVLTGADLVLLQELFPGAVAISSEVDPGSQEEVDRLIRIMESMAPAGVRVDFLGIFDADEAFAFDGDLPGLGFGSTTDPLLGGKFATLVVRDGEFAFDGDDLQAEGFGTILDPLVGGQFQGL